MAPSRAGSAPACALQRHPAPTPLIRPPLCHLPRPSCCRLGSMEDDSKDVASFALQQMQSWHRYQRRLLGQSFPLPFRMCLSIAALLDQLFRTIQGVRSIFFYLIHRYYLDSRKESCLHQQYSITPAAILHAASLRQVLKGP